MGVMHASHEALLTILEVLLYDPLYAWTLSPEKAALLQQNRDLDTTANISDIDNDADDKTSTKFLFSCQLRFEFYIMQKK